MLIESVFSLPFGAIAVQYDEHEIYYAQFTQQLACVIKHTMTDRILSELDAYLKNAHHRFNLPLKPTGSDYQRKVWNALKNIKPGHPLTYGELATQLQSAPRAIGQACKRNPIALFIPCHRVIGKNSLGGFMGRANRLDYKSALLAHEA